MGEMVVWLANGRQRKTADAELVGFSRATDPEMMVIGNALHSIDKLSLSKLGQEKGCDRSRGFDIYLEKSTIRSKTIH